MREWTGSIAADHDVVVVGSGAIGLTAALAARREGARVALIEKADHFGGTAALSGGMVWVPMNRYMHELGIDDDRGDALSYLRAVTGGRTSDHVLEALVDRGVDMLAFLETEGGVRFCAMDQFPDYHPEWDGAHSGGRSLDPLLFDASVLGELYDALRPDHRPPFTMVEYEQWGSFTRFPWDELAERAEQGFVARGRALVAPLLHACAQAGVTLVSGAPVRRLLEDGAAVTGVVTEDGLEVAAPAGVILASGGFEWNDDMTASFLPGPVQATCGVPSNTGDGIRMASKAGAALGNMGEAWWFPMLDLPGEVCDGRPAGTLLRFERTGPHTIIVNRAGGRFVNEAHNYNDMVKAFHTFDPRAYTYANLPAHLVFDQQHLERYGFLTHRAGEPTPEWLATADTPRELAGLIGVDPDGLEATLQTFNSGARKGVDPEFHRNESAYDRYWGDREAEHPALGPVEQPPFYAVEVKSGCLGTKGGIVTDGEGRGLDAFGDVVPGLLAAGNTTAHPMGPGYPGAGGTLGPGCTMAFLAGKACVRPATATPPPREPRAAIAT